MSCLEECLPALNSSLNKETDIFLMDLHLPVILCKFNEGSTCDIDVGLWQLENGLETSWK